MCGLTSLEGRSAARVLIVGAGPTGLMLALCLKRYGILADIVDAKSGPSQDSKALAINPMSQIQSALFFGEQLVGDSALPVSSLNVKWKNEQRLCHINLDRLNWFSKDMLIQTQFKTEQELVDKARQNDIEVNWKTRVISVDESPSKVDVRFECDTGPFESTYEYVIGCDGKRSIVRDCMGSTMEGKSYEMFLALADFNLDVEWDEKSAHYIIFEETFFVLVPLGNRKWRIVVKHDGALPDRVDRKLVTDPVERYLGKDITLDEPSWLSMAPLYVSCADLLSTKRLHIAGDAAHLYSPIGGTGMNTGFLDALNLGWKLAYSLMGYSQGEALMSSYQEERLPAIQENATSTDRMTQLIARMAKSSDDIEPFLPKLKNRDFLYNILPVSTAGLSLKHSNSSVIFNDNSNSEDGTNKRSLGTLNPSLTTLLASHSTRYKNQLPLVKLIQFIDSKDGGSENREILSTNKVGTEHLLVSWHSHESSADKLSQADVNFISGNKISIPKTHWELLAQQGEIKIVRPDGIISYEGSLQQYQESAESPLFYLTNID